MEKPWGNTEQLIAEDSCLIFRATVREGGFCSVHRHIDMTNHFVVTEGQLALLIWDQGLMVAPKLRWLTQSCVGYNVAGGFYHQFLALSRCTVLEIYRPKVGVDGCRATDIQRYTPEGGTDVEYIEQRIEAAKAQVPLSTAPYVRSAQEKKL